jgi:hypothetical protein
MNDVTIGLDIEPERGAADSGDLEIDLPNLFVALAEADAAKALNDPAQVEGVIFEPDALVEIYRMTKGYPYFLQEWSYQSWKHAKASPITLQTIQEATNIVIQRLDKNFFRVRFDRLIPSEKNCLRAMDGELHQATPQLNKAVFSIRFCQAT